MGLEQKAALLIERYKMIGAGDKILCAFSGGSDSSALLHFLAGRYGRVYAAHLNHGIRGADADADEAFAGEACARLGVELFTGRLDVPRIAKRAKKSVEAAARDERYAFLGQVSARLGGSVKICTAHTMADNTESVLINLARGTGLAGLCGIAPVAENIARPFLTCEKRDILEYCRGNNIDFREDASNADELYTRNFIRHSVAAKLRERYAALDGSVMRMSDIMRESADFIDQRASEIAAGGGVDLGVYAGQHKAVRRALLVKMCRDAGGEAGFDIIEGLDAALLEGRLVRQDLPGGAAAELKGGRFRIYKESRGYRGLKRAEKARRRKNNSK